MVLEKYEICVTGDGRVCEEEAVVVVVERSSRHSMGNGSVGFESTSEDDDGKGNGSIGLGIRIGSANDPKGKLSIQLWIESGDNMIKSPWSLVVSFNGSFRLIPWIG